MPDIALNCALSPGDAARPRAGERVTGVPIADFNGRVAVTGAGSRIGRGIAAALADAGATVVVADAHDLSKLARWVHEAFGRVDILVNNAGVGPLDEFRSLTLAVFRWVMDINFWGVVHGITAFLPYLEQNEHKAAILNTASMPAVLPNTGITTYGAWKAAVLNLSDSLRAEFAPAGRTITPEEVGALVVNGLHRGATHLFTQPETRQALSSRHDDLLAAYDKESA